MLYIAADADLISFLKNDYSLISGSLNGINISYLNSDLTIELSISLMYAPNGRKNIVVKFINVISYSFIYDEDYSFSTIEDFKFIEVEGKMYLSIDPDIRVSQKSEADKDFIISKSVVGFFL